MTNLRSKAFLPVFPLFLIIGISSSLDLKSQSAGLTYTVDAAVHLPLCLVKNQGQFSEDVKFSLNTANGSVFLFPDKIVFQPFRRSEGKGKRTRRKILPGPAKRMIFIDSDPQVRVEGLEKNTARFNYFIGSDPEKWKRNVPTYTKVVYRDIYPSIDLIVDTCQFPLQMEFHVKEKGDIRDVKIKYDGVEAIETFSENMVDQDNTLRFRMKKWMAKSEFSITTGIDYSTFLGGSDEEMGWIIAVDAQGNAYVAGETYSYLGDYPTTPGAYDRSFSGEGDIFVSKLDPSGSTLIYSTYIGGSIDHEDGVEGADGIAVDSEGNVYLTGWTSAYDFPTTPGAFDSSFNGGGHEYFIDAFATKLDASGSNLLYSTYIGGNKDEWGNGLCIDDWGNCYIVGVTYSSNYPVTAGAFDTSHNGGIGDGFITKVNPTGTALVFSTYFGGSQWEEASSIVIDDEQNVYISGHTESEDLPTTPGAYSPNYNDEQDGFISKFDTTCSTLLYSTFLGGSKEDSCDYDGGDGMTIDQVGNIYVVGETESNNFPTTPGAYDRTHNGGWDAFVTVLNPSLSSLVFSTFLGGSKDERGNGIAIDDAGGVYFIGDTKSGDFPTTPGAFDTSYNGRWDIFVALLVSSGSHLAYSTFVGGSHDDECYGMALDSRGSVYVGGWTKSGDYPTTPGAYDTSYNGEGDTIVTKISMGSPVISGMVKEDGGSGIKEVSLTFSNGGGTALSDDGGHYSHSVSTGWSGTVTPTKLLHTFTPQNRSYNDVTTNIPNQDYVGVSEIFSELPPLNFTGQKVQNRSFSQVEYINVLEWQANPSHVNVAKYRIYLIDGEEQSLLAELDASTFRYWHRKIDNNISYTYAIVAVDIQGRESLPAEVRISST